MLASVVGEVTSGLPSTLDADEVERARDVLVQVFAASGEGGSLTIPARLRRSVLEAAAVLSAMISGDDGGVSGDSPTG